MSVGGNETSSRGHIFCEELQGEGTAGTREVVVLYILITVQLVCSYSSPDGSFDTRNKRPEKILGYYF